MEIDDFDEITDFEHGSGVHHNDNDEIIENPKDPYYAESSSKGNKHIGDPGSVRSEITDELGTAVVL